MMSTRHRLYDDQLLTAALTLAFAVGLGGCRAMEPHDPPPTVMQAWESRQPVEPVEPVPSTFVPDRGSSAAIATVNGEPIDRARVYELLVESHGVDLLDQLIVLTAAKQRARELGITISPTDIEAEYDRSLDALLGNSTEESPVLRRKAAESMLARTLESRNTSRAEYMIVMERNAILRQLVTPEIVMDERQLRAEHERMFGERVQIRHIQTATLAEIEEVLAARAQGVEFGVLAVRHSANRASADRLGLLPPFTDDDPKIPKAIRKEAFLLPPGLDSNPIQADGWYHLIRVERRIPAENVSFDGARKRVEQSLRDRLTEEAMHKLYTKLFNAANVDIADAKLKELFYDAHPNRGSRQP